MLPEIKDIIRLRKKLNLTQTQLAKLAGVSQSFIAKLERGKIDPSFSKVKQIIGALRALEREKEVKVKSIMSKKVYFLKKTDRISKAVKLMNQKNISQIPIKGGNMIIGSINEKSIIDNLLERKDIAKEKIEKIMEDPFPVVNKETSINLVTEILKENNAVLVVDKGRVVGIVTRADLFKTIR